MRIFISYRRADSADITGRLFDHLIKRFGSRNVFKDVDDIPIGESFPAVITQSLRKCDILLVIIGPKWVSERLHAPNDFVRQEIEFGLTLAHVKVIPVLVNYATMPSESDLPESLHPLTLLNAAIIRNDPDFRPDVDRLIRAIVALSRQRLSDATDPGRVLKTQRRGLMYGTFGGILALTVIIATVLLILLVLSSNNGNDDPDNAASANNAQTQTQNVLNASLTTTEAAKSPSAQTEVTLEMGQSNIATGAQTLTPRSLSTQVSPPTEAFPDGRVFRMLYDDNTFVVANMSSTFFQSDFIGFEALLADGSVALSNGDPIELLGTDWSRFYGQLDPNNCLIATITGSRPWLQPSECRSYNATITPSRNSLRQFWLPRETIAITEFRVLYDGQEAARCPLHEGSTEPTTCEVKLP